MTDAETLLLVHDEQTEILEFHGLLEKLVGTDDQINSTCPELLKGYLLLSWSTEPAEAIDNHRETPEPGNGGLEMLLGQDGGGDQNGHLLAVHNGFHNGTKGNLGLAEAYVAAQEPVHGDGRLHIILDLSDTAELIVSLGIGEIIFKLGLPGGIGGHRLWPHKLLGEGHYAAVLEKAEGEAEDIPLSGGEKLPKPWLDFARELGITLPRGKAVLFGQTLYWAPEEMPQITRLKVLRPGLELGEVKKDRFEPAHALALWLKECKNEESFGASGPEMANYLHGDVIPSGKKGWCLVKADGYSIGWGKGDGRVLKNHYPKGLRISR